MKKIYIFLFSIFFLHSFSQAPKLINYQGVVRNSTGVPLTAPVKLKFQIFPVSSGGTAVFTEIQSTVTNSLGLFSTQIGKNTALNINWNTGSWFLELSVDTTNSGSSFITIGRQQMVSVPFALYAENAGSAPSPSVTFSNNILYVGTNSVSIPSAPLYTGGNGITVNSTTITNSSPDQTVTISAAGNASVNSAYPNFTVGVNPQVIGITNNVITLSNGGGSITLPATSTTPNTSLTSSGIATVTSSGTNTFNVAVSSPTITGSGGTSVSGSYPNFIISSPTVAAAITPTITGTGVVNTSSSGNNYTVNVPGPQLSIGGNILTVVQGTASSAVTLPTPASPTITGQGIATVTPLSGNNFTVNVAPLNLTGAGSATVSGSYPNITVNTPFPPAPQPAWLLQGNSGTVDGTHFIGTTDNVPLSFKVNNQKSGRIDPFLSNTFFGYWAGRDNTIGTQNTAFGINALLNNTSGAGNTAYGTSALGTNTTGSSNTALGNSAGFSNTGSNNVFIGYQAGYNATGSSQLYIANSNTPIPLIFGDFLTNRVGLGTTTPGTRLEIVQAGGALRIVDGSQGAGKVFTSDGTGLGTWQVPAPSPGFGTTNYLPKWNAGGNGLTPTSLIFDNGTNVGIGTASPASKLEVAGTTRFIDNATSNAYSSSIQNNIGSGISGGALEVISTGQRSIDNSAMIIQNLVTKSGGSGSTKTGLSIQSTGSWAPGTGQSNVGLSVNVSGADINRSAVFTGGGITIMDGSEGIGKVLTSDPSGNATWKPLTVLTVNAFNGKNLASVGNSPTPLNGPLTSFTKNAPDTKVEIIVQTHLNVGDMVGTNSVVFEMRVNGIAPAGNSGRTNYFIDNNTAGTQAQFTPVTMIGQFPTLTPGSYNVEIWVYTITGGGTASSIAVDPGNYSASSVTIKEYR